MGTGIDAVSSFGDHMAQYHFAATIVCRSKGQSAVAAAAYRAGVCLEDERTGRTFDYTRRRGVLHTEISTPANDHRDRGQLWNAVEKSEKRKDSQLARSIDIALPHELSLALNLELVRGFVREKFVGQGMIADFAIHSPGRNGDIRNVHVHILLTTREVAGNGFGRKQRDWNDKKELLEWRKAWAEHANRILEREGFEERIDHRTLSDQGIDREPTTHVGPAGKEMDQRGVPSDRARQNRDIKSVNDNLALLKNELAESQKRLAGLKQRLAAERMEQIQKIVRAVEAAYSKAPLERPAEPMPPPAKRADTPARAWRPPRPSAAERIQQAQKIIRAMDAALEKPERQAPAPDRPPEPESPAPPTTPERAAEPGARPAKPPELPSPTPRRRRPSHYDVIDRQKYDERAEEEQKQDSGREREKEEQERERKPDRDR